MITHNIPFEDEITQTCLNHHKGIWSMEIIISDRGTQELTMVNRPAVFWPFNFSYKCRHAK